MKGREANGAIQAHPAGATARRPEAVRAETPGWYMSRAWAPGRKKAPGVTALAM